MISSNRLLSAARLTEWISLNIWYYYIKVICSVDLGRRTVNGNLTMLKIMRWKLCTIWACYILLEEQLKEGWLSRAGMKKQVILLLKLPIEANLQSSGGKSSSDPLSRNEPRVFLKMLKVFSSWQVHREMWIKILFMEEKRATEIQET